MKSAYVISVNPKEIALSNAINHCLDTMCLNDSERGYLYEVLTQIENIDDLSYVLACLDNLNFGMYCFKFKEELKNFICQYPKYSKTLTFLIRPIDKIFPEVYKNPKIGEHYKNKILNDLNRLRYQYRLFIKTITKVNDFDMKLLPINYNSVKIIENDNEYYFRGCKIIELLFHNDKNPYTGNHFDEKTKKHIINNMQNEWLIYEYFNNTK